MTQIYNPINKAIQIHIADGGNIITGVEVETALQENRTAIDLNTAHVSADGSSHTFIDQDVTIGSGPAFTSAALTTPAIGAATGTSLTNSAALTLASTAAGVNINTHTDATDDFTVNTSMLVVEGDTGNVGIGTTGPLGLLQVGDEGSGTSEPTYHGDLIIQGDPSSSEATGGMEFKVSASGDGHGWKITALDDATDALAFASRVNSATWTDRIFVQGTTGNVGIGTTAPIARLQIGDATVSTANQIVLGKYEAASQTYLPVIQQKSILDPGVSNDLALGARSGAGGILFYTGATDASPFTLGVNNSAIRMAITSTGNVGIGTTGPGTLAAGGVLSGGILHVYKSGAQAHIIVEGSSGGMLDIVDSGGASDDQWLRLEVDGGIGTFDSFTDAGGYQVINILSMDLGSGNIGIGTADPGTAGLAVMNGNVGIGTTSPTNLLSLGGESARIFWMERELTADTAGNTLTITAGGATSGATNKAGGDLILQGGLSTGSAESGVTIQGCVAGASGTADRTQTTAIEVTSNKIGFWATTPAVRAAAYTISNAGADRAYDANATTIDEISDVLGTLIADLITYGLLTA